MIIESITPHPSEEDLDVATLGPGIKCVVHKGQFKTGDSVKFVPVKTVKKGILCYGLIAHDDFVDPDSLEDLDPDYHGDSLSMAEVFSGSEDILERVHAEDPDSLLREVYIDDAEEDAKDFARDED